MKQRLLAAVYIGIFDVGKFKVALIDAQPDLGERQSLLACPLAPHPAHLGTVVAVNDLYGRLFATWTLLTCGLCLICAKNPTNSAIYGR